MLDSVPLTASPPAQPAPPRLTANQKRAIAAIQNWLKVGQLQDDDYLFKGQRGCLSVETVSTLVKTWCRDVGLKGIYGSHTLRKPWGYWQRMERGTAIPLLMEAFGHATQQQTLDSDCLWGKLGEQHEPWIQEWVQSDEGALTIKVSSYLLGGHLDRKSTVAGLNHAFTLCHTSYYIYNGRIGLSAS